MARDCLDVMTAMTESATSRNGQSYDEMKWDCLDAMTAAPSSPLPAEMARDMLEWYRAGLPTSITGNMMKWYGTAWMLWPPCPEYSANRNGQRHAGMAWEGLEWWLTTGEWTLVDVNRAPHTMLFGDACFIRNIHTFPAPAQTPPE